MRLIFFNLFFVLFLNAKTFVVPRVKNIACREQLLPSKRRSSFPYISGDTFRSFALHVIDEIKIPFDPNKVNSGDTIFVNANYIDYFFSYIHSAIKKPYILITHNSDLTVTKKFRHMLNDDKIIAWFAQNVSCSHTKLFPIPIGLANALWPHGNTQIIEKVLSMNIEKDKLCYVNFNINTNIKARQKVHQYFKDKSFCYSTERKNYLEYIKDLARSKFVVSPLGNGFDCHRTWEALIVGAIPIIESSPINSLFDDLPVLIVHDWSVVTQKFLEKKYEDLINKKYNYNKLYVSYWFEQIKETQRQYTLN